MNTHEAAEQLLRFINARRDFVYHRCDDPYGHMGATIADSILQANNRYSSVEPRVSRILTRWPKATTVTAVLDVLAVVSATGFLNWQGKDRAHRFCEVLRLLKAEGVESESDFRTWLEKDSSLSKLRAISGIGPKTIDYFRIMVGLQGTAIDRRLLGFLALAGISITDGNYNTARDVITFAADLAGKRRSDFDHSIWRYMGDHEGAACA
jgi:hypothetical protein